MVCEWGLDDLRIALHDFKVGGLDVLALKVSSASGIGEARLILINNGKDEIRSAANQRHPDLLKIVRDHNPDIESELDKHVAVERREIVNSVVGAATKAKSIRI